MSAIDGSTVSSNSSDSTLSSAATANDYEIVPANISSAGSQSEVSIPEAEMADLKIVGDGNESDLKEKLRECMVETTDDSSVSPSVRPTSNPASGHEAEEFEEEEEEREDSFAEISSNAVLVNENIDAHTVFHNVTLLGSRMIKEPKNEQLIHALMKEMNVIDELSKVDAEGNEGEVRPSSTSMEIKLRVPRTSEGWVFVCDTSGVVVGKFPIYRIIFFARGNANTSEAACFAFTCAVVGEKDPQSPTSARASYECHVFRCKVPEAVTKVFVSFAQAFRKPLTNADPGDVDEDEAFIFEVSLEVKENVRGSSGGPNNDAAFEVVPRQKGVFKLRSNVEKKVVVSVQQVSRNSCRLGVERCFGMLVSPGRNVRHADMQLLEQVTMATMSSQADSADAAYETNVIHVITGLWDPRETALAMLNNETPPEVPSVFLTIAADLVMTQVAEPVRFVIETRAKIYPQTERYWYYTKKIQVKRYRIRLRRRQRDPGGGDPVKLFDVRGIDISEEIEQGSKRSLSLHLANLTASTLSAIRSPPIAGGQPHDVPFSPTLSCDDDDTDNEEPVLSGFGAISKDCSVSVLDSWSQVLNDWDRDNPLQYPKQLANLVREGIPEALRGEVWQRLTGASVQQDEIVETYRILITKESPDEKVILRDIHRTFPAHELFKEAGGIGQESLYRISKAYSVYDSEIGYCQGQSFLIAALVLQMPEEQAFGVLVKVMHDLGLRDMFRENFEQLQLKLYQLDRLLEVYLPDLWHHFVDSGVESHMYASQWFLTLFTAKFPLYLVFRVLDVFLLQGLDTIFQVALAILTVAKRELLQQDFEGLMKYFRVNIPKTYRSEEKAKHLMAVACNIKLKKLKKYEKDYLAMKEAERAREDPVLRLERENKKLQSEKMRLEMENEYLARELVNSKIEMRRDIDIIEDEKEHCEKELEGTRSLLQEAVDEKKRLEVETEQLKALLKREVAQFDTELATKLNVIAEYKIICTQLSEKLEKVQQQLKHQNKLEESTASGPASTISETSTELDVANQRVRELELELAQTKLALVETECKNQDLTHQFSTLIQEQQASLNNSGSKNTWFSKTLSSIRESAAVAAGTSAGMVRSASSSSHAVGSGHHELTASASLVSPVVAKSQLLKSSSIDYIRKDSSDFT